MRGPDARQRRTGPTKIKPARHRLYQRTKSALPRSTLARLIAPPHPVAQARRTA